jgi:hypothetical protein
MNTIIGPPLQNSTDSQFLWNNLSGPFPRAAAAFLVALSPCRLLPRGPPGPAVRVPREGLLARGEGSEFAKIWGPARSRGPVRLTAQCDDMLAWQDPKAAGDVALACSLVDRSYQRSGLLLGTTVVYCVITIRARDITATS